MRSPVTITVTRIVIAMGAVTVIPDMAVGRVAVRVFTDADGGLCLSVFDTGIGMTAKEIEVALAPFGQVDSRITRKHKGTGLGLPICKSLMELHGGELLITSEPNVGTTLIASFPRSRVCEPPNPARLDRAV